jgi:hypothetical protein
MADPIQNHCANSKPGWRLEDGSTKYGEANNKIMSAPSWYRQIFEHSEHTNFVGVVNKRGSMETFEPIVISILAEDEKGTKVILWTRVVPSLF